MAKIPDLTIMKSNHGKSFAFPDIIETIYDRKVIKFSNPSLLLQLKSAANNTISIINSLPGWTGRVNEFGNYVEIKFAEECLKLGLKYTSPKTTKGGIRATGYPDGFIDDAYPCYVEIKTYADGSENSSFRSFYFSPSASPKITQDASHLLVGFATTKTARLVSGKAHFTDMFLKQVKLKLEFQQNNKHIYNPAQLLQGQL
ncbi:hypothetical protein [Candidatus Tokpelaia sp.]|uniref:hypothetical protein n=1 Tax=Candidatus Tokpelaia sp. TaxID=2233777 RepID=UPI001238A3F8|nr:hypothetical protein [Candidatus Tokpelaia sp.]